MRRTMTTHLNALRAVDLEGRESASPHCRSFTRTTDIAAKMRMSVQEVTPLLRDLLNDGLLTRTTQPDGTLTWHLRRGAAQILRAGEVEIAVNPRVAQRA